MEKFRTRFSELIGENKVEEAFDVLFHVADYYKNTKAINQLLVLKASYVELKRNKNMGVLNDEISSIKRNRITERLVNIKEDIIKEGNLSYNLCVEPCKEIPLENLIGGKVISKNHFDSFIERDRLPTLNLDEKYKLYKTYLNKVEDIKLNVKELLAEDYNIILFRRLIFGERLEQSELQEIAAMPYSSDLEQHEKSLIISAITVRMINSFDKELFEYLINFSLTFEEGIWEKALVGMVLIIKLNSNNILLYPKMVKKLKRIKEITSVQEAISRIDYDLLKEHYKWIGDSKRKKIVTLENEFWNKIENWFKNFTHELTFRT